MNKTQLLDKYATDSDSRLVLARVLDQQQRAEQRGLPTHTAFLSPAQQAQSADLLMAAAPGQGLGQAAGHVCKAAGLAKRNALACYE